jgi:HlyD family secretion protein
VTEKIAEQGELLQVGSPLCVVTDLADAWLTVYVAEPDLGRIRIGQEADVVTDGGETRKRQDHFVASQAEFTPRTSRPATSASSSSTGEDRPGQQGRLFKPGMPAEARLRPAGSAPEVSP